MRSIQARFTKVQNKNPNLGSLLVLALAVKNQNFTQTSISRDFTKLVPSDEYVKTDRIDLIKFLTEISRPLEDDKISEKND